MNAIAKIPAPGRRAMLAKIHVAKKQLALTDDSYRDLIRNVTGKDSSRDLDDVEAGRLMARFLELGFKEAPRKVKVAGSPLVGKARALWSSLHWLGAVDHHVGHAAPPDWRALDAFVARMTDKEALAFCAPAETVKVIEGLRAMCRREGFDVDDKADAVTARCALVRAIWFKLPDWERRPKSSSLLQLVACRARIFPHMHNIEQADANQLDRLIIHIGRVLRQRTLPRLTPIEPLST